MEILSDGRGGRYMVYGLNVTTCIMLCHDMDCAITVDTGTYSCISLDGQGKIPPSPVVITASSERER